MPGSCSSGFRSRPSAAGGIRRSNGFDVNSRNSRKPTLIRPITDSTRATSASGRLRENTDTATAPAGEHQRPQQQRAFVRAPGRGDAVVQRQLANWSWWRRSAPKNRWSTNDQARHANAMRDKHELRPRRRPRQRHQPLAVAARAPSIGTMPCVSGDQQRQDQREVAELGNHRSAFVSRAGLSSSFPACAWSIAACACGGM